MLHQILLPTDATELSARAAAFAIHLAKKMAAKVTGVIVTTLRRDDVGAVSHPRRRRVRGKDVRRGARHAQSERQARSRGKRPMREPACAQRVALACHSRGSEVTQGQLIRRPSAIAVKAPHGPRSQPFLAPVKSSRSRRRLSIVTRASLSSMVLLTPLMVSGVEKPIPCSIRAIGEASDNRIVEKIATHRTPRRQSRAQDGLSKKR
jgi:hypothetical protein